MLHEQQLDFQEKYKHLAFGECFKNVPESDRPTLEPESVYFESVEELGLWIVEHIEYISKMLGVCAEAFVEVDAQIEAERKLRQDQ